MIDLAGRLARIEIVSLKAVDLGGGVRRVEAVAANTGELPTHTKMAARTKSRLPVRLELETGGGVELVTGYPTTTSNRLEAQTGTLKAEWLVRTEPGATITVRAVSENAGTAEMSMSVQKGGSR